MLQVTESVQLRVRTPVRLENTSTTELTVIEGDNATLDCKARYCVDTVTTLHQTDDCVAGSRPRAWSGPGRTGRC